MVFSNTMLLFINFSPGLKKGRKPDTNQPIPLLLYPSAELPGMRIPMTVVESITILAVAKTGALFWSVPGLVGEIFTRLSPSPEKDMSPPGPRRRAEVRRSLSCR
jgi:hypothetical protein